MHRQVRSALRINPTVSWKAWTGRLAPLAMALALLDMVAVPVTHARGNFAAARPARRALVGHAAAGVPHFGHVGHFVPRGPRLVQRSSGPVRFARDRFRGAVHAAPRFAPGVRVHESYVGHPTLPTTRFRPAVRHFGDEDSHFPRVADEDDHFRHFDDDDADRFHRFGDDHDRFPRSGVDEDSFHRFGDDEDHFGPFFPVPWGGGDWGGLFWPRVYYGASFAWFLPSLHGDCPVYRYDNVPYHYCDGAYYVWSPGYHGYIASNPPPVQSSPQSRAEDRSAIGALAAATGTSHTPSYSNAASAEVFAYPERGQSRQQQLKDRRKCAQSTASQLSSQAAVTQQDYRRAMIACLDARGYSAR